MGGAGVVAPDGEFRQAGAVHLDWLCGQAGQPCCIGVVEHAATLQVGEMGTVASAATAVGIAASAAQAGPPPVVFDRLYLMVVTDRTTGEPLFMARVTDPAQP
jgi:serine protease inhibitor